MSIEAGTRLADRYRLLGRIGMGGMGSIWRAVDEVLDREIAVKVVAAQLSDDPEFALRFRREAKAAARLDHPHIAHVYDYGEIDLDGRGVQYLVMELLTGRTLADRLRDGPMSWRDAVAIGSQVASALAAAHRRGVVHRDVTPGNIMLTAMGAKVLDFGVSTIAGETAMTAAGRTLGTPAYLAPERLRGRADSAGGRPGEVAIASGPPVDVYSLGAVLVHTVTGRTPYEGSWSEQAHAHVHSPPPAVTGVPGEFARVLHACLDKDPASRPSADAVAARMRELIGESGRAAPLPPAAVMPPSSRPPDPTRVLPAQSGPPDATRVMPAYGETGHAGSRRTRDTSRIAAWVALLAATVIAVLVAANLLTRPSDDQSGTVSEPELPQQESPGPAEQPPAESDEMTIADVLDDVRTIAEDAVATGDMSIRSALELGRLLERAVNEMRQEDFRDAEKALEDAADRLAKRMENGEVSKEVYAEINDLVGLIAERVAEQ